MGFYKVSSKMPILFLVASFLNPLSFVNATEFPPLNRGEILRDIKSKAEYRLTGIDLGQGAYGKVFLVKRHDKKGAFLQSDSLDPDLVVKMFKSKHRYLKSCHNESDLLSQLEHPYIVRYFSCFVNYSAVSQIFNGCILVERLGPSLYHLLEQNGFKGFNLDVVENILLQVFKGVEYIHSFGVIHTDLKPENILAANSEAILKTQTFKIIDFGSAVQSEKLGNRYFAQSRYYRAPDILCLNFSKQLSNFSNINSLSNLISNSLYL